MNVAAALESSVAVNRTQAEEHQQQAEEHDHQHACEDGHDDRHPGLNAALIKPTTTHSVPKARQGKARQGIAHDSESDCQCTYS